MKNILFKKIIALFLTVAISFSFVACVLDDEEYLKSLSEKENSSSDDSSDENNSESQDDKEFSGKEVVIADSLQNSDMKYVLIYNPGIYDSEALSDESALKTGSLGSQIELQTAKAVTTNSVTLFEVTQTDTPVLITPDDLDEVFPWQDIEIGEFRGDAQGYDYSQGDVRKFYACNSTITQRIEKEFECVYAGEYCYIWTDGTASESELKKAGKEFDENIYENLVSSFGTPRFVGDSGKVNMLVYPMMNGLGGFFTMNDLFAAGEVSEYEIEENGINTNHAIINMNSIYLGQKEFYSTMAHECQHLICGTNYFSTANEAKCPTWFNEAMSGYIEEKLYGGIQQKSGRYESFNESSLIRNGQSMYNFGYKQSYFDYDIGVYGSVYYFAEYLADASNDKVFSNFHKYWRESYSQTLCVSEALANSVTNDYKKRIKQLIEYPSDVKFETSNDEFMSKMVLDFYLTSISKDYKLSVFENIDHRQILYNDEEAATIEGGGRIIIKVKDGKFEIPDDADSGLIYIGLDANFNPVTDFVSN